jgi:hypothetical protein
MLPKRWPKWTLILIAFVVVAGSIVLGLLWEPIGQALAPAATPVPTQVFIKYAAPLSDECVRCHTTQQSLDASAESPEKAKSAHIDPASLETPHGRLGCITCHGGSANQASKAAAHEGLIQDLSETHPQDCLLCHRNLPAEFPNDYLRTPHGAVVNAAWEGSACGVKCSDCHGAVGHGFDPVTGGVVCNMTVCLDCHVAEGLGDTLNDCNVCHVGPHDVALALSCKDCHTSTETWRETVLRVHPMTLAGGHADVDCFTCHRWPNFKQLASVCSDCHSRPHSLGNDNCALCHTPDGWKSSADALVSKATEIPHPVAGREDCRSCHGMEGGQSIPADHKDRTNDTCEVCHIAAPAPAILHPVLGHESCLTCHGEGQIVQFPIATHKGRTDATCSTCHEPSGVAPLALPHSVEGRDNCLMCHGPQAILPYPETHTGWGNPLCLLCHQAETTLTAMEHTFPQDHDGAAKNCVLCHPQNDFSTYHCDTCHATGGMTQVHSAKGINAIQNICVLCHPKGTKP